MILAGVISAMFSRKEDRAMRGRNPSALRGGEDGATPVPFSLPLADTPSPLSLRTSFPRNAKNPSPKGCRA